MFRLFQPCGPPTAIALVNVVPEVDYCRVSHVTRCLTKRRAGAQEVRHEVQS